MRRLRWISITQAPGSVTQVLLCGFGHSTMNQTVGSNQQGYKCCDRQAPKLLNKQDISYLARIFPFMVSSTFSLVYTSSSVNVVMEHHTSRSRRSNDRASINKRQPRRRHHHARSQRPCSTAHDLNTRAEPTNVENPSTDGLSP